MTAPTAPPVGRPYIILMQDVADTARWTFKKIVQATTSEGAIKSFVEEMGSAWSDATIVAVPERSWTPKTIAISTKTTVSFS